MTVKTLQGDLTIYSALEQKEHLLTLLASSEDLEIDLSQISEIDTAGLQLLVMTKLEAVRLNKPVRFTLHSTAVQAALELTNLSGAFGDPIVLARGGEVGA